MFYNALSYKTKQFFYLIIKLSIVVGATYFIYNRLINNEELDFKVFTNYLAQNKFFSTNTVSIVVLLTIINWVLEILKWQLLVNSIKKITFYDALKQSLASHTASLITPNRIGDYGAKVVFYGKPYKNRIVLLNLINNIAQMNVTLFFGIIGFFILCMQYDIDIVKFKRLRFLVFIFTIVVLGVFGKQRIGYKIKGFKITSIINFIKTLGKVKLFGVQLLAIIRYLIFSFQFFYILSFFKPEIPYYNAMLCITSMYLISSLIPMLFIFDVIVKGSIAIYLFHFFGIDELTILSTVLLMWLLNFVLPSFVGGVFVLNFNFKDVILETRK